MNGSEPSVGNVGRVEICYENRYGTVCDDLWDEQAARVVCNGSVGIPLKGIDSIYGSGNGSIILDNVVCNGIEDNLLLCAHNELFDTNCDHTEDAAVVCGGKYYYALMHFITSSVYLKRFISYPIV